MSGAGNGYDNAVAKSFFATLKQEHIYRRTYQTRVEASADVFHYIEVFYNRQRRHSTIAYMTPTQSERRSWQLSIVRCREKRRNSP